MSESVQEKKTYSISQAAGVLGLPVKEVERLVAEGKLAHTNNSGSIEISSDAIEIFKKAYYNSPGASF